VVVFLLESALVVLTAAVVGLAVGWTLARRRGTGPPPPAAATAPDDGLAARLADCRERGSRLVDDMGLLRRELATRYTEAVRLTEDRDDARAGQRRAQVDLANRTAELIVLTEEFGRFRQAVRDRYGDEPDVPAVAPASDDGQASHRVP